ncbi:MAG: succinate--CoA ligase subunit alpha [Acidimicrobiia bacterium]|nr:succinate--CoA ligase subunit alpha [Acidimicrobiia bacterium]MBT8194147.1 succinate--CoA ligase subunit alpha [Acidimicrobiia bacterium]NNL12890.1 succinate--CoA ligase subunit alpha [Acidimicrobiia bacterium]NNL70606.1 succinate--CoA ligase subunit alpha [Acidimicrobiia bacterium]RZV40668.1 MAG: succinate--CoA ligase subunit alpha [Acidimicrobiia bacterium]
MAILIDENTKLVVQGLTGKEGQFHGFRNRDYGTNLVAGVTPGKGGTDLDGVPIFNTVSEAVDGTGANTAMTFVPPPFAADAILEAAAAGIALVVAITEGIPAHDEARVYNYVTQTSNTRVLGPNCPGLLSPGKANVGIMPPEIAMPGRVGVVSRSGTLTYQAVHELTMLGIGQSSCIGIGGDPVPGTSFVDVLDLFQADEETDAIVMIGEIGGTAEEEAADFIKANVTKPVVSYIAGVTAPPGKKMGHAGAIISGGKGTAAAKMEALTAVGATVLDDPTEIGNAVKGLLG